MSIYIHWSTIPEPPTNAPPFIEDTTRVLSLKITHREGEVAMAELTVPQDDVILPSSWACIYSDERGSWEPIFYGHLINLPLSLDSYTKKIQLLAIPQNVSQEHQRLIEDLRKEGLVNDFFIDPTNRHNPSEYLEATPQFFCYHRIHHTVNLSNLFEGRETIVLKDQILMDGLTLKLQDSPLSGVHLKLSCEWVQEAQGELNLMPLLEHRFSQGLINTLTPTPLLQHWPRRGQMLGRSGYAVVRSTLSTIDPNSTGVLGHYPTVTPPLGKKEGNSEGRRFQRYWLQGQLHLAWHYRQKRKEVLSIDVQHDSQLSHGKSKEPRILKMRLNDVQSKLNKTSASQFLDTPEAASLRQHALNIAKCHLAYSARVALLTVEIPFHEGFDLHLDQNAKVEHASLPQGCVTGKIIEYRLEKSEKKSLATVKIALATGISKNEEGEESELIFDQSKISGDSEEAIHDPETLSRHDFIEELTIYNTADEQIAYLQEQEDPTFLPPDKITQISLRLKDIRTHDVIERHLSTKPLRWTAPQQIKL